MLVFLFYKIILSSDKIKRIGESDIIKINITKEISDLSFVLNKGHQRTLQTIAPAVCQDHCHIKWPFIFYHLHPHFLREIKWSPCSLLLKKKKNW